MVDKKLSSFPDIQPSDIKKLICLFLDQNNAIKNGNVDFAALDALFAHKAGAETFTGNKTFSGDAVFSGNTTFNNQINGTCSRATQDADGNTISSTYAKKGSANTFTANNTFSGNRTVFNGSDVVVQADTDFSGSSNTFGNLVLKKYSGNTVAGGELKFQANTSDPTQYDCRITRINGTLEFGGINSSGNSSTPFVADIENGTVVFSSNAKKDIVNLGMPDWSSAVSITLPYTAPKNGYILRNLEAYSYIHLNIGNTGLKSYAGATNNSNSVIIPVAKGNTFSDAGNSGTWYIYFIPCKGEV